MSRTLLIRICIVLLVLMLMVLLGQQLKKMDDMMKLVVVIALGAGGGFLVVKFVMPWFGDALGEAMFSSGEKIEQDEMMKAAACISQGDYEGAIEHYEKMLEEKEDDPFPVAEIAKVCAERLRDPQRALQVLETHLQSKDWPVDDAAFIMFRIADMHQTHLKDLDAARHMLEQVIGHFPSTRHSANAHHKIGEIEQAQFKAMQEQRAKAAAAGGAAV